MRKVHWILSLVVIVAILAFGSYVVNKDVAGEGEEREKTVAEQVQDSSKEGRPEVKVTENPLAKTEVQGEVTVQVSLLPEQSNRSQLVFEIAMNTHSVDLLQYELASLAEVSIGTEQLAQTFEWESMNNDSHHMKGRLIWKGNVEELPETITLVLKNIDQIPSRSFSWNQDELVKGNLTL